MINSYSDLADYEDLTKWLRENFTDLDAEDLKAEKDKVLQDTALGLTEAEREEKLSKARQVAMSYNIIGGVLAFTGFFFADHGIVAVLLLIYPLAGILIMKFSNRLVKFASSKNRSVYPFVMLGFYLPVLVLFITSILKYDVFNYHNFWPVAIGISMIVTAALVLTGLNRSVPPFKGQVIVMLLLSALYSYGSTVSINCRFDQSKPNIYGATVLGHRISKGKSTSYYLTLSPWGPSKESEEVSVDKWLYY